MPSHFPLRNTHCRCVRIIALLALLTACANRPKPIEPPPAQRAENPVLHYALSLQGAPYAYGKASPEEGFDCSGFIWHVFRRFRVQLPRTAEQMAHALPAVAVDERLPGDLLFFATNDKPFSHVALYLGENTFIHAPSSNTGRIMLSGLDQPYWRMRLAAVRRPPIPTAN